MLDLDNLHYGTLIPAGRSYSTIIATFDFETYSPAGFEWKAEVNSWQAPKGASNKEKGLPIVGATCYTEHPDAEVLCLAYDLKDGFGKQIWWPGGSQLPLPLFKHVREGKLLEAWNCMFEYLVWKNICIPKYNFPPLPPHLLRDAMAKSRAFSLPGKLENAGKILDIKNKKDPNGERLIKKYSVPRNPTKNNSTLRNQLAGNDLQEFINYNIRDIIAEAEISRQIPDLQEFELKFWQIDQQINLRGVQMDIESINNFIAIIEQAYEKYNAELKELTFGAINSASEVQKLIKWLSERGIYTNSLNEESLNLLLNLETVKTDKRIKRVLEIRQILSSAAVKKTYAMTHKLAKDGRLHDLFIYHSARTGRAAGAGVQPQNLPNSGPEVLLCNCGRHHRLDSETCPWCGYSEFLSGQVGSKFIKKEWNPNAVEDAIAIAKTQSLECLEYFFGKDVLFVISACLRGLFIAKPGYELIASDYSAIEAVVLAVLAGEEWRLEVFRTHGKIYEMSASKITGIPFEEFERYKKETDSHHPARKTIGKVAELACFSAGTQVLTKRGYVGIKDVRRTDLLWDGLEWVRHQGIVKKGKKQVIELDGIKVTPHHPISLGDFWKEAKQLASNENMLSRALAIGSANLPYTMLNLQKTTDLKNYGLNALVAHYRILLNLIIYVMEKPRGVMLALKKNLKKLILNYTPNTFTSYLTRSTDAGLSIDYDPLLRDVTSQHANNTQVTAVEELKFFPLGKKIPVYFYSMFLLLIIGITQGWKWIELMLIKAMNQITFALYLKQKIQKIKGALMIWRKKSNNLRNVYDIVNAGPRNRFTIKTNNGHLIVHNSGYQGWVNAWKHFGADEFFNEQQIREAILVWRKASPAIVNMWAEIENAAIRAVIDKGSEHGYRGTYFICENNILYCKLLSGRYITYHKPTLVYDHQRQKYALSYEGWNTNIKNGPMGWIKINTWGGRLVENIVQATARDILAYAIVNLEEQGFPVVLHVHDEIVVEAPENTVTVEQIEVIMNTLPLWAKDWPIKASGGWKAKRYQK